MLYYFFYLTHLFLARKAFLILALILYHHLVFCHITEKNTPEWGIITAVLMVKNEGHQGVSKPVIIETLEPLIQAGITSYIIYDTGSQDNTTTLAQELFEHMHIQHYRIYQEPFVDFSTSRNRALDLARQDTDAPFLLMPDAEWILHNGDHLINYCQQHLEDPAHSHLILLKQGTGRFHKQVLIKTQGPARFASRTHETISQATHAKVPETIFFERRTCPQGRAASAARLSWDKEQLLKDYQEDPTNCRALFYLAQTCCDLGEFDNAYTYYQLRAALQGWHEERFIAFYRLAHLTTILGDRDGVDRWPEALSYYLAAYDICPSRAEPLVQIADHYWRTNQRQLCYLFAQKACMLPYPQDDILFIESDVYDYARWEILSRCAWYCNDLEHGIQATRRALAYKELPHLYRNLATYLESKNNALRS